MNKQKKKGLILMVVGTIFAIGALIAFINKESDSVASVNDTVSTKTATTTNDLGLTINGIEGATIELVEVENPEITFKLHRPIIFTGAFANNEEAQGIITKKIDDIVIDIEETGGSFASWLDLGIYWKQVDDYEGAVLAWNYASKLRPLNHVSYMNLGNLYHLYIKDFEKSEVNFQYSIANKPDNVQAYLGLYSLYADSYVEKETLADDVLLQGLQNMPNNITLTTTLARYYVKKGDMKQAQFFFDDAIRIANDMGDDTLAESLSIESKNIQ